MDVLRFRWNGSELVDVTGAPTIPLYVADSFLLDNGKVVGYDLHLSRFRASVEEQGLKRSVESFLEAVTDVLPRTGTHFPRSDLTERGELELHIRPAPPLTETLVIASANGDPRLEPGIKGPDIPALNALREEALTQGAQDAVILSTQGHVVDGSTTCLVWADGNTLFTPPDEAIRVNSTTVAALRALTSAHGFTWAQAWIAPEQLTGKRLYALNALHGIRAVTQWVNGPKLVVDHNELQNWRSAYDARATEVAYS